MFISLCSHVPPRTEPFISLLRAATLHFAQWRDTGSCSITKRSQWFCDTAVVMLHSTKLCKTRYPKFKTSHSAMITVAELSFLFYFFFPAWELAGILEMKLCSQAVKVIPWRVVADRTILGGRSSQSICLLILMRVILLLIKPWPCCCFPPLKRCWSWILSRQWKRCLRLWVL